jgi:hypothetical protein
MLKHGKSSGPLLALKQGFTDQNDALLAEQNRLGEIYRRQPRREVCVTCGGPINDVSFSKCGIDYCFCDRCGHLNGAHQDSDAFCHALYTEDGGKNYAKTYTAADMEDYQERVSEIYLPKAQFLFEALQEEKHEAKNMAYADLGAGSGYFVAALLKAGASQVRGYEVSEVQVGLANSMIGAGHGGSPGSWVEQHAISELADVISNLDATVVSLIGVLEHLQSPRDILAALTANPSIRYLFLSVPLFSPTVFLEMVFPTVMQRHLAAGHTHLFTQSSLQWIRREYGMREVAAWWFGADMMDLMRMVAVRLAQSPDTVGMVDSWRQMMGPTLDGLQLELDKRHLSSEVHTLLAIDRQEGGKPGSITKIE